jgi:hypothetical protein
MRWLVIILLISCATVFGGYVFLKGYPHRLYSNWIQGKEWNKYYKIEGYTSAWLAPVEIHDIDPYKEDYSQLWREFPLRNARIPLPVRHPLFVTVPLVEAQGPKSIPHIGMIFLTPAGRELSRVYTLPVSFIKDHTMGQDLFKLPFVKNRILKLPKEKLWNDIFSYDIIARSKSFEQMIYELYLLHLRSQILPKSTIKYGLLKDNRALIELESRDKDYMVELIMANQSGNIYSYVLRTEINNDESRKLRSKFLESISFAPADPAMGKFLYTEFKQLNFARQVDQEGMLYLFSGWSQDFENFDMFKEMIFYLERGQRNVAQLKPLYKFAFKRFGKTFTQKAIFNEKEDQEIVLQRKIEIENMAKASEAAREKEKPPIEADLTPDEKMNLYLKKAKEEGPAKSNDMTIH